MFGNEEFKNVLYLIDFGLCKKYRNSKTGEHVKFICTRKLNGTAKYASVYALSGYELSRRDDLESLCYLIIYLLNGSLPWEKIRAFTKSERYKVIYLMKKNLDISHLIKNKDNPEFVSFFKYCKNLKFEENPDYEYLRGLMLRCLNKNCKINNIMDINKIITSLLKQNKSENENYKINSNIEKVCDEESLSVCINDNKHINEIIPRPNENIENKIRRKIFENKGNYHFFQDYINSQEKSKNLTYLKKNNKSSNSCGKLIFNKKDLTDDSERSKYSYRTSNRRLNYIIKGLGLKINENEKEKNKLKNYYYIQSNDDFRRNIYMNMEEENKKNESENNCAIF